MSQPRGSAAYVAPFAVFLFLLAFQGTAAHYLGRYEPMLRALLLVAVLAVFSRDIIVWRPQRPLASLGLGLLVYLIWVGPEQLFPHYREHWLFHNFLFSEGAASLAPELRQDVFGLTWRSLRAIALVPIIEELFWRGWLMRYLIDSRFEKVPLGTYQTFSFWMTAVLFASEHGAYWDVGLAAGVLYNAWMLRTRSLADCILAHAVTNAALCAHVLTTQQWRYWQ